LQLPFFRSSIRRKPVIHLSPGSDGGHSDSHLRCRFGRIPEVGGVHRVEERKERKEGERKTRERGGTQEERRRKGFAKGEKRD